MNRLDEIHLDRGKNGIVDLVQIDEHRKQIRISVCNSNNVGVHSMWIDVPNDTLLIINEFPSEKE